LSLLLLLRSITRLIAFLVVRHLRRALALTLALTLALARLLAFAWLLPFLLALPGLLTATLPLL
jgi:hypothetical protein